MEDISYNGKTIAINFNNLSNEDVKKLLDWIEETEKKEEK